MRELEFLPAWYPQLRQRKRLMVLQGWMSLLVIAGLALWLSLINRNISADEAQLRALTADLSRTQLELHKLDDLLSLQKQLRVQDQVMAQIGLHVETTRLINALESAMSRDMSLLDLSIAVSERNKPPTKLAQLVGEKKPEPILDRRLDVTLRGVAPTDLELANFLYKLSNNTLFEAVTLNYARERREQDHLMRAFEVSFSINLNQREG